jgi:hypothetical protein
VSSMTFRVNIFIDRCDIQGQGKNEIVLNVRYLNVERNESILNSRSPIIRG